MAKSVKTRDEKAPAKERLDGRVAFFTYMLPKLKDEVKQAAAEEGLKAWQFIERAVQKALKAKRRSGS